jgi:hypothetical protein
MLVGLFSSAGMRGMSPGMQTEGYEHKHDLLYSSSKTVVIIQIYNEIALVTMSLMSEYSESHWLCQFHQEVNSWKFIAWSKI